jgi:flagellar hook protein FlgE
VISAADPSALTKTGGSLYQANASAGVGAFAAPNGTSEQILSNSLESSNVDMSTEFVNMITTQRAYSANSKTITTADQMTQEVLGLIR